MVCLCKALSGPELLPALSFSPLQSAFSCLLPASLYLPRAASIYGAEKLPQGPHDTTRMTTHTTVMSVRDYCSDEKDS